MSIILPLDDYDLDGFSEVIRTQDRERFKYVVTPNTDHIIRYCDDPRFRRLYAQASYVLLDSRFAAALLAVTKGLRVGVCTGSDLTYRAFSQLIQPDDRVVLVGCKASQAAELRQRYNLKNLQHIVPPMGFINDPDEVEKCLSAIEAASPFRFCFLAIGSPQQEIIAQQLKVRERSRGLALCIGAAINFITGEERRAPRWMQKIALEWLFRLLQDPRRLSKRYFVRGPRIFLLWSRLEVRVRRVAHAPGELSMTGAAPSD